MFAALLLFLLLVSNDSVFDERRCQLGTRMIKTVLCVKVRVLVAVDENWITHESCLDPEQGRPKVRNPK